MPSNPRDAIIRSMLKPWSLELKDFTRILMETAFEKHAGNKSAAARELGISVKTLRSKLKDYSYAEKAENT